MWIIGFVAVLQAAEPLPPPYVEIRTAGTPLVDAAPTELTVSPGATLELRAIVLGGQRAYCMYPERYAELGPNGAFTHHGLDGCTYVVSTGSFDRSGTRIGLVARPDAVAPGDVRLYDLTGFPVLTVGPGDLAALQP